jgi:ADP-ribosylglycohydrolase
MAIKFNSNSMSNGSLMRCTPLAVWLSNLENNNIFYKIIEIDVTFTHPNK